MVWSNPPPRLASTITAVVLHASTTRTAYGRDVHATSIAEEDDTFVTEWLKIVPTVPSHYCRQSPAYQEKKFLQPGTTMADLHREFSTTARESGRRVISIATFSKKFHQMNFSTFVPKKDQCNLCVAGAAGNVDKEKIAHHKRLD